MYYDLYEPEAVILAPVYIFSASPQNMLVSFFIVLVDM